MGSAQGGMPPSPPCGSLLAGPAARIVTWRARHRQLFIERMSSKAIVAMVVVDHMDPSLHNGYKDRMTRVKQQLRHVHSSFSLPHAYTLAPIPTRNEGKGQVTSK